MTSEHNTDDPLPQAVVDTRRRLSLIWLIPLVTLLAAAWLAYHTYSTRGPLVTISFKTAEGLEAGKTRVRFKDVDVGLVEEIGLSPDLSRVKVRARLSAEVAEHLNQKTRFWVVRARLSGGEVSGLGTLVGGTFIAVDLTREGAAARNFEGLESPPIVTATDPGKVFQLKADTLGSLSIGSPVQFQGIEVGRVIAYDLSDSDGVDIRIFIDAPHDARVRSDTRFWNTSGVEMALDASGIRLNTESLASMLLGGIAFDLPHASQSSEPAAEGSVYRLHPDRQTAFEQRYQRRQAWRMAFAGSVRGLLPGAPVEFRGIRLGEVSEVRLELDPASGRTQIPVIVAIEPERLAIGAKDAAGAIAPEDERALWDELVRNGLRAQLKTGNLVTGALYVDLDFYPDEPPREIDWEGSVPELPTVLTPLDELRGLLSRLARLPLDQMGRDLSDSLASLRDTMEATNTLLQRLDRETASELNETLAQTRRTLVRAEKLLAPNSPLQSEAHRVLRELGSAARSFRIMADYLERHPEALIRGKGAEDK